MFNKKYLTKLIKLNEAIEKATSRVRVKTEKISTEIEDALNSILAEDIVSTENIPAKNRSEVDGYAVKSSDLLGASYDNPVALKITDRFCEGCCMPVNTGQYIEEGFDAVCMIEYTKRVNDKVLFYREVSPWENVTPIGYDFKAGEVVLRKGTVLTEFDLSLLASLNIRFIKVFRRPFIGVLNVGSELIPLGEEKKPDKKVNSNEIMILSLMRKFGLTGVRFGIVEDNLNEISKRISLGLKLADSLIITGGTAVSKEDLVIEAVESMGEVVVRGISIRPGRPTSFGVVDGKPIFMLSGNPVACAVGFLFFTLPVLEKVFKMRLLRLPTIEAKLSRRVGGYAGYRRFVRVKIRRERGEFYAEPISIHGSSLLSTLTKADGFMVIPENVEGFEKGTNVEVTLYRCLNSE